MMKNSLNSKEIVTVGAGPVGLWTAIQIKKRNPSIDIYMYEKHDTYQRSHVLRLDYWSLILYSKQIKTIREEQFYKEITGENFKDIALKPAKSIYIRTNELEAALKSFASDLGIKIIKEHILKIEDIQAKHINCSTFLIADGAKSNMRQLLLGENCLEEYPLQHVVEIKYQIAGKANKLEVLNSQLKTNKTLNYMAFEYVGKEKNNITPITIRFFLDKETYEAIPEASFKKPISLENDELPHSLKDDIMTYMNIRNNLYGEKYESASSKISKLTLSLYASNKFAIKKNDSSWFLVGDAAMGVPYFRALNSGMILGSRLGQILTGKLLSVNNNSDTQIFLYNLHRTMHIATEFGIARGKNLGLQGYDWFRKMSSQIFPPEWDFSIEESQKSIYEANKMLEKVTEPSNTTNYIKGNKNKI